MKTRDIPVVFMSYDEPWADDYWQDLHQKAPWAKRVHGVEGLDACHKAALAATDGSDWVITVDADTIVRPSFFEVEIPDEFMRPRCRIEWPGQNVVNGLAYGNGSLKCWPAQLIRDMKTHEAAPRGSGSVDHDIGGSIDSETEGLRVYRPSIHADVNPALTPYHAFRCGFREGARLALNFRHTPDSATRLADLPEPLAHRLAVWCSVGADYENGGWLIYGARLGLWMAHASDWSIEQINSYRWLDHFWHDLIKQRFTTGGRRCRYTGFNWDDATLSAESAALGVRLAQDFGFDCHDLTADESRLFKESAPETLAWNNCDSFGYLYLKGLGLNKDLGKAREMFELGEICGVSASVNNLARMKHLGQGEPKDPAGAMAGYERAIEMGNAFAPYHLASLLEETSAPEAHVEMRVKALRHLAARRGFDPDRLMAAKGAGE